MKSFGILARLLVFTMALNLLSMAHAQDVQVSGIVTDARKQALTKATVTVVPDQPRYYHPEQLLPWERQSKQGDPTTETNAQGEFTVEVTTTGPVALLAWAEGYRMTKFPVDPVTAKDRMIGLALAKGFDVHGRIVDDATGAPVAHATVGPVTAGLETQAQRALRLVPQWTKSDDQGQFVLRGLADDIDHTFLVQAPGYTMANVEINQGQAEITVHLSKGGFALGGQIFARGQRDETFAGKTIRVNGNGFNVFTQSDPHGKFALDGLPGGTFSIEPLFPGGGRAVSVAVVEMPRDDKTSISLEVSGGYNISGMTVDVETSMAVHGVPVGLNDHWTTSSTDGRFQLGPFYTAQPITPVVPEADGWKLAQLITGLESDVADGFQNMDNIIMKVQRRRLLNISLTGFERTTSPVMLTVIHGLGAPQRVEMTSATAAIPVFAAGHYTIYAVSGGLSTELVEVNVGQEPDVPVSLQFQPASEVTGTIQVTNSLETTRVQTLLVGMYADQTGTKGPAVSLPTQPMAHGHFRMPAMPGGKYLLSLRNQSATQETTQAVALAPGLNDLGVIKWRAGHSLSGIVSAAADKPVPFAEVAVMTPDGKQLRAQSDEAGRFEFQDIYADSVIALLVESAGFALYTQRDIALPAAPLQISLKKLGTITITVDAASASVWSVQIVRMSRWGVGNYADQMMGNPIFHQEATGGETLETSLGETGRFRVVAANRGFTDIRVSEGFDWAGDSAAGKNIALISGQTGTISGKLTESDEAIEITLINCSLPEQTSRDRLEKTVISNKGNFQANGLVPGTYMVLAQGDTYTGYLLNVEVRPGETTNVTLDPVAPMAIEGVVMLAGEPLGGAVISLLSETDQSASPETTNTDAEGRFSFPGILADIYQVSAQYDSETGILTTKQSVAITEDNPPAPLNFDLTPPAPVQFTIAPGMTLAPGTAISLMNKKTRQLTTAQWIGNQLEASVAPGEYEVWQGENVSGSATVTDEGNGQIKP